MREPRTIYVNPVLNIKPSRRQVIYIGGNHRDKSPIDLYVEHNYNVISGLFQDKNAEFCDVGRFEDILRSSAGSILNSSVLKNALSLEPGVQGLLQYVKDEVVDGVGKHTFLFYVLGDNDDLWQEFKYYRDNVMIPYTLRSLEIPVASITPEERDFLNELRKHFDSFDLKSLKYQLDKFKKDEMLEVSPMRIDKNGVIWFDKYGTKMELQATHLAIYLHYLRHPEGIKRQDLDNYRAELSDIYRLIKPVSGSTYATIERSEKARDRALTNLFQETEQISGFPIYTQYVSKIKNKLKEVIPTDALLNLYAVIGKKGEGMKINLSLSCVSVEEGVLPGDFLSMTDAELHAWKPGGGRVTA